MKREFWAEFDLYGATRKQNLIKYFVGTIDQAPSREEGLLSWELVADLNIRQQLLAQLLASEDGCGHRTKCKDYAKGKNGLQRWYYAGDLQHPRGHFQEFLCSRMRWMASILGLVNQEIPVAPPLPDLSLFPPGSWAVQVAFILCKPYISRDDVDFYILDNPVKKEHVFKVPYVAPSQWKGALRAAMVRELVSNPPSSPETFADKRFRLALLFGDEKGEEPGAIKGLAKFLDDTGGPEAAHHFRKKLREHCNVPDDKPLPHFQGRLHFYPTFFDRIGLEVINPHPRETGAGKQPIYFECVPAGTPGVFTLLYVPLDKGPTDETTCKADLEVVARGIRAMLTVYGFGAKTSSGYGVAKDEVEGHLSLNFLQIPEPLAPSTEKSIPQPEEIFQRYLDENGEVRPEYLGSGDGGLLSNTEFKNKSDQVEGSLSEFRRFRAWYIHYGEAWKRQISQVATEETSSGTVLHFSKLSELVEISQDILEHEGGNNA